MFAIIMLPAALKSLGHVTNISVQNTRTTSQSLQMISEKYVGLCGDKSVVLGLRGLRVASNLRVDLQIWGPIARRFYLTLLPSPQVD